MDGALRLPMLTPMMQDQTPMHNCCRKEGFKLLMVRQMRWVAR